MKSVWNWLRNLYLIRFIANMMYRMLAIAIACVAGPGGTGLDEAIFGPLPRRQLNLSVGDNIEENSQMDVAIGISFTFLWALISFGIIGLSNAIFGTNGFELALVLGWLPAGFIAGVITPVMAKKHFPNLTPIGPNTDQYQQFELDF